MKSIVFSLVFVFIYYCTMTSFAMTLNKFVKMTNSSGAPVCTTDLPAQVMSLYPGGETRCGTECSVSPACAYFQFKSAATPEQCQLYNQPPVSLTTIDRCIGYSIALRCPTGWIQRGRRCYKLSVGQFQSWYQAENYCTALNAPQQPDLVSIESVGEQLLVTELISQLISVIPPSYSVNVNLALFQTTWQSSTSQTYSSNAAVDGNRWPNLNGGSCAMTMGNDSSPWLAVDLGKPTVVYATAVTNRADANPEREDKFIVGLTNNPPSTMAPTSYGYTKCGQWPGPAPASATMFVKCVDNLPPARYVVIIQNTQPLGYLQICELEVYGKAYPSTLPANLALYQPTWQSSNYGNYPSKNAVDGKTNPDGGGFSCALTSGDPFASWLAVDLGNLTDVYGAAVTNRVDGSPCKRNKDDLKPLFETNAVTMTSSIGLYNCPLKRWTGGQETKIQDDTLNSLKVTQLASGPAIRQSLNKLTSLKLRNVDLGNQNNFLVGLSNNPPNMTAPASYVNTVTKCGQWPSSAPAAATMFVKCVDNLPPARYVVIQRPVFQGWMGICELEVYAKAFVWMNGGRPSATSQFVWNPNQPSSMPLTYTNWAMGFPAINSSSCLAMDVSSGSWLDKQCITLNGTASYALCETPAI